MVHRRLAPLFTASVRKSPIGRKIDPILISIMLATILAATLSISAAVVFSFALRPGAIERMISLSVGLMLATALLHALPAAFESGANARNLLATMLAGLFTFFLLEKTSTVRNSSRHQHAGTTPFKAHSHKNSGGMVLIGESLHNFSDGILIAAAFLANPKLGLVTGLAIIAHEVPQRIGDFVVLLDKGFSHRRAVGLNVPCSAMAVAGGLAGYLTLDRASGLIPYLLAFSSSGFIYIALSDLMPQMHRRSSWSETVPQVLLIGLGISVVLCMTGSQHA
jgi:zinc and cadmium transporter